jgi:Ca2+-binding RTX toxin-like protein
VITVADGARLDYQTDAEHSIVVTVTDAGGLSDSATYLIAVEPDTSGDNVITGDASDNLISGGVGDDRIFGLGGNDELMGGDGNDELDGGDGNDFVFGDQGDDQLIGGDGNDQLFGGLDGDVLDGGGGNDWLQGGTGNDALKGGIGQDTLHGGAGADVLEGGAGNDTLSGGSEADRFVFTSVADGFDQIVDFGADDVLAIGDALVGFAPGDEAAFVNLVDDGTDTTVQIDPDGAVNGTAFTSIAVLAGVTGMTLGDFVDAGQIDFWMS